MIIHNVRSWRILYYLTSVKDTATAEQLAAYLDVSPRTVKNDMKDVRILARDSGCELISQKARGYTIVVKNETIYNSMKDLLFMNFSDGEYISKQDANEYQIMRHILMTDGWITEEALADAIYVSVGTVKTAMPFIKSFFQDFNVSIEIKPSYGLRAIGTEINLRFCLLELLMKHHPEAIFLFDYPEYERLFDFTNVRLKDVRHLFMDQLRQGDLHLVDAQAHRFVRYIALMYNRVAQGHTVCFESKFFEAVSHLREYRFVDLLIRKLHQNYGLPLLSESEILSMAILLLYWADVDYRCDIQKNYGKWIDTQVNGFTDETIDLIKTIWHLDISTLPLVRPLLNSLFISMAFRYRFPSIPYNRTITRNFIRNDILVSALATSMAQSVITILDQRYGLNSESFFVYELGARLTVILQSVEIPYQKRRVIVSMRHGLDSGLITKKWLIDHYGADKFECIDLKEFYEVRGVDKHLYDAVLVNSDMYYYHYDILPIICRTFPTQQQAQQIHDQLMMMGYPFEAYVDRLGYPHGLTIDEMDLSDRKEALRMLKYRFALIGEKERLNQYLESIDDAFVYHDIALIILPSTLVGSNVFEIMHLVRTINWFTQKVNHILLVSVDCANDLVATKILSLMIRSIVMDGETIHTLSNDPRFEQLFRLIRENSLI